MPSQKQIFTFLLIASAIGLLIITVRRISDASCVYTDTIVCQFLRANKKIAEKNMQGTFEINAEVPLEVNWSKEKNMSVIRVQKEEEEILYTIIAPRYVYIKDYADNKWWREQKNTVENALSELPFNPELYFNNLQNLLTKENNIYRFVEETTCDEIECYRYQVTYPEQPDGEQLFIFFSKDSYTLISVFKAFESGTQTLSITYAHESVTEPTDIKVVSSGRNIFMEYTQLRDTKKTKNFEYLQQFQEDRMSAEGTTTIPYIENRATEESEINEELLQ